MNHQLVLLTGFLGAGKTTFLNHILREYENSRVGMIVNEFSQTGVDGALIRRDIPGAEMVELNNGSIFCACIKDSFVDSLVAPLSLINALLVAIARSKSDVVDHFERLEHIWEEYGVFVSMEDENQ